ncbi:hypothetical protein TNIN_372541 [Trichonephila inaurata madagascariensis]|uniref:Uncharacterized protein n=1 Tax=Trichonephila inaurata madagascariensis TaxID=2747483 RepID=A0A8X6Y4K3_9ARAC|nr:hypothetical protein TNIN_372541 [Trichonephila inaurata madagascariensis]
MKVKSAPALFERSEAYNSARKMKYLKFSKESAKHLKENRGGKKVLKHAVNAPVRKVRPCPLPIHCLSSLTLDKSRSREQMRRQMSIRQEIIHLP